MVFFSYFLLINCYSFEDNHTVASKIVSAFTQPPPPSQLSRPVKIYMKHGKVSILTINSSNNTAMKNVLSSVHEHPMIPQYVAYMTRQCQDSITRSLSDTTSYSCHGVFTDRSIFSLNLSRFQIPTGTPITNCNHKHGLMLTCSRKAALFYPVQKRAHVDWNWPFRGKII